MRLPSLLCLCLLVQLCLGWEGRGRRLVRRPAGPKEGRRPGHLKEGRRVRKKVLTRRRPVLTDTQDQVSAMAWGSCRFWL
jgi:hypothetical protein